MVQINVTSETSSPYSSIQHFFVFLSIWFLTIVTNASPTRHDFEYIDRMARTGAEEIEQMSPEEALSFARDVEFLNILFEGSFNGKKHTSGFVRNEGLFDYVEADLEKKWFLLEKGPTIVSAHIHVLTQLGHGRAIELLMEVFFAEEEMVKSLDVDYDEYVRLVKNGAFRQVSRGSSRIASYLREVDVFGSGDLPAVSGLLYEEDVTEAWRSWWVEHKEDVIQKLDGDYAHRWGDDAAINLPSLRMRQPVERREKPLLKREERTSQGDGSGWGWSFFFFPGGVLILLALGKLWDE